MSNIKIDQTFQETVSTSGHLKIYRLLWKSEETDLAWIIEVPSRETRTDFCKGPKVRSYQLLLKLLDKLEIVLIELPMPALWNYSDAQLKEQYSNGKNRCSLIDARDMRWGWIEGLVMKNARSDIFEGNLIPSWVNKLSANANKSRAKIYNAIHSYFSGGSCMGALLYNWPKSGGKGKQRAQIKKLGRPNALVKQSMNENIGFIVSDSDKEKIQYSWTHFVNYTQTVQKGYREMLGIFYNTGTKEINGELVPILLPQAERPSITQFSYWGRRGDPSQAAWIKKLPNNEWEKKFRGLNGTAKDGVEAVGQLAYCDTTTNDVHLVSLTSRLKPIGTLNRLMICEAKSGLIIGFHCGFDAPSSRTFLSAVAHAASSKVDYCARFGIKITEEEFPALAVKTYLGDNGEYRSETAFNALKQFGSYVELAASGKPQFKGPVEGNHHVFHSRLDHTLPGTTYGRQRERGEVKPALKACLTYYEYVREFITEVIYYNTKEIVRHLLTAEMDSEGVQPTRIAIFNWLVKKGKVIDFKPDVATLRAHLYPALPALLTSTGVYLLREDRGNLEEIIIGLKYMSDYLIESSLLSDARTNGTKRITVRCIPENPQFAWLVTDKGLKQLENMHHDALLNQQATIQDLLFIQDGNKPKAIIDQAQTDQDRSDIECARRSAIKKYEDNKKLEIDACTKRPTKLELTSGIESNRREETARLNLVVINSSEIKNEKSECAHDETAQPAISSAEVADPAKLALMDYIKGRKNEIE